MTPEYEQSDSPANFSDLFIHEQFVFPLPSMIRHVETIFESTLSGAFQGEAKWAFQIDRVDALVSWKWVELRPEVVMLSDPNSVRSNVRFMQSPGQPATGHQTLILLNTIVHSLDWQSTVTRLIAKRRDLQPLVSQIH